jgi:DNA primase
MPLFAEAQMDALRLEIPGAKDPDELVREQGAETFRALLDKTEPLMELVIRWYADRHGATPMGRQRALEEIAPLIAAFPEVARASLVRRVADVLYLPEPQVVRQVRRSRAGPRDPEQREQPQARATRFTRGLHDLLWLLVHFPDHVAPIVEAADPNLISESHSVLDCIGALLRGQPLTTAMELTDDQGLRSLLISVGARQGLYAEERAQAAAQQILARLELPRIHQRLAELHRSIDASEPQSPERRELISERLRLIMLKKSLEAVLQGRFAP